MSSTQQEQPPTGPSGDAYEWFVRGRTLYEDGSAAAAVELFSRALAAEPEARSIRESLARALFDSRRYDEAASEFETLVRQAPDDHYAHFGAGLACWRLFRLGKAAEHLAIAVAMRPHRKEYRQARDQVRATIRARVDAGLPLEGPVAAGDPIGPIGTIGPSLGPDGARSGSALTDPVGPEPLPADEGHAASNRPTAADAIATDHAGPAADRVARTSIREASASVKAQHPGEGLEEEWTAGALCRTHDVVLLDLDGVVYRGPGAVPHAVQSIRAAQSQGLRAAYVTNNASRTASEVAEHLQDLGLDVDAEEVVTSAQAGAALIRERLPARSRVLAVGGPGVPDALQAAGLTPVRRQELAAAEHDPGEAGNVAPVAAVLMGYGPNVGWADLAEASYAVGAGAFFVATNTDLTVPTDRGVAPGNGTLVAAVAAATGRTPEVAGKPFSPLLEATIRRTDAASPLVVGDRLDTDIEAATRLGLPSLLVLTGVTDVPGLLGAVVEHRPTYVTADLRGLLGRGRPIRASGIARVDEAGALHLADQDDATVTADPLRRLRAAAAACWAAADSGGVPTWSESVLATLSGDVERALDGG